MSDWSCKVYVVQAFTRDGEPREVLGVKLTREAAQRMAFDHAPAKVVFMVADKGDGVRKNPSPVQSIALK